jgi:gamma-glutamyl:cysteine ligase YbdK (ATP-grasp superfamily)
LFLVDPVSGHEANASTSVQQRLGPVHGTVERELHACLIELITDVCRSAGEAVGALRGLRRAVLETGAGLLGSGTHPSAIEGEAEITDKEGYERIRELLGDAVATPVAGLHIHVGMPDADGDPGLQRSATPSAVAAGAGRELAVSPWSRYWSGVRSGGDDARLAAFGCAARDA